MWDVGGKLYLFSEKVMLVFEVNNNQGTANENVRTKDKTKSKIIYL